MSAFLAATILPFSSEAALVAAVEAGLSKETALLAASSGNVLAITLNYFLGVFLFVATKKRLLHSKMGRKIYLLTKKHGYKLLFLSWLPLIGDPITIAAGVLRLHFVSFFLIVASLRIVRYIFILSLL